jgi:aminoglycoside phosphotransferase (APT) family kinase protein
MDAQRWTQLAERFALGSVIAAPAHVARGAMGDVWRLDTTDGRWAVKWQFSWAPTEPSPADIGVQRAAAAAGIPLPLPVLTPAGEAVAPVGEQHVRVYEWAELGPPLEPPAAGRAAAEAGRLLGMLHRLALAPTEPDDPWYTAVSPAADWAVLADRAAAAGVAWAGDLATALRPIARLSAQVDGPRPGAPRIVCHRDFSPANVLPTPDGGRLVVLDWENAGPLDPRAELGYVLFAWSAGHGQVSASAIEALLDGYAAGSGAAPEPGPGMFVTAIAATLNFLYVMAEQAVTEPGHAGFADQQVCHLLRRDLDDLAAFLDLAAGLPRLRSRRPGAPPHGRPLPPR